MREIALEFDHVWKKFRKGEIHDSLRDLIPALAKGLFSSDHRNELGEREFWAVQDVSFQVKHGEALGIIGPNGAGKSTILRLLSKILRPDRGRIAAHGRLGALIEVGAGFHPDLTGRENIYLNGTILGMKRHEIDKKLDEIVAFSGIEEFLDTPVKRYSSGMYARLGFSVAAHLETEILLVDEILSVGDMSFQRKCFSRMGDLSGEGRAIVSVSHNLAALQNLCDRLIVLNRGRVVFEGPAGEAIEYYVRSQSAQAGNGKTHMFELAHAQSRSGPRQGILQRVELLTENDLPADTPLPIGATFKVNVHFRLKDPVSSFELGIGFDTLYGQRIFTAHTTYDPNREWGECVGEKIIQCEIPTLALTPGDYKLKVSFSLGSVDVDTVDDAARFSIMESDYYGTGRVPRAGVCVMRHRWRMI
jgi:lipopolysaccharide transport system ATP-binding protein